MTVPATMDAAAADPALEAFFNGMRSKGGIVVEETPHFDLESYIQQYKGSTRFDRLLLIGRCSVPLCRDALRAAMAEAFKGNDVGRYRAVWQNLRVVAPDTPAAVFNQEWVDLTEKMNKEQTRTLEKELKMYRNNLIKESIRMGHEDLGKHLEAIGDYVGATEAYNRMRPDVSTPRHIVDMSKHLVSVAIKRGEWTYALAQLHKISGLQVVSEESQLQPYTRALSGVCLLGQGKYAAAAKSFLEIDMRAGSRAKPRGASGGAPSGGGSSTVNTIDSSGNITTTSNVGIFGGSGGDDGSSGGNRADNSTDGSGDSAADGAMARITDGLLGTNDVAVYGGLLALATMNRQELQTQVLENARFRPFLELEPHVRRAISQFVNGRYAACLSILEAYRPDYLLDLFLQKHVEALYASIRSKCIVSYLAPFSCVTLATMNASFSPAAGTSIEDELATMIRDGVVRARIDAVNKLVRTVKVDPRVKLQRDGLAYVDTIEKDTIDRLRRMNLIAAGLEVRGTGKVADAMDMEDEGEQDRPWSPWANAGI